MLMSVIECCNSGADGGVFVTGKYVSVTVIGGCNRVSDGGVFVTGKYVSVPAIGGWNSGADGGVCYIDVQGSSGSVAVTVELMEGCLLHRFTRKQRQCCCNSGTDGGVFVTGMYEEAAAVLHRLEKNMDGLAMVSLRCISLARRQGNFSHVDELYKDYISKSESAEVRGFYVIKYARYLAKVCVLYAME